MAIALSHGGTTIYTSASPSNEVLVGTREGIVTIQRNAGGQGWHVAQRALTDRHIHAIIMEPESGALLAGAHKGGVSVSLDGGKSWADRNNGLTELDIYSLATAKIDGRVRIYAGTEPAHLFVSEDLGLNWTELPALTKVPGSDKWSFPAPPHVGHLKHINFDPRDSKTMFGSIEVGGLFKSTDAGQTWTEVPGMYEDVHRTVINPANPERIYVTGGDGVYVTSDGGAIWEHWADREAAIGGYPDLLVFEPRNPDQMFISAAQCSPGEWRQSHFAGARISHSGDGGRTWEVLRNGLPDRLQASVEAMCLEQNAASCTILFATTSGEVYCSDDAGEHWSLAVNGLAPISKGGHYHNLAPATA
jgi:photosystem II stability/assembly factor-like uncharacterized protein